MKPLVIYHANCADGFGAAWAVIQAPGFDDAELFPASYGDTPPDVTGRLVVMVDFSYKRPVIDQMVEQCAKLCILDHHKTAEAELDGIFEHPKVDGMFDMDRSGAMMAWEWFHSHTTAPALIQHIQDRDLWRFEMGGTREFMAAVFSYPQDIDTWTHILSQPGQADMLYAEGKAILRAHNKNVEDVVAAARSTMEIDCIRVPCANVPHYMASDAGHILAKGVLFAATYYNSDEGTHYSLRSAPDGVDVSAIAKKYGGGGHKHAAGFTWGRGDLCNRPGG